MCGGGSLVGLVLNEVGFAVGGVIQVNGATPVLANAAYCQSSGNQNDAIATVRFVEKTKGYVAFTNVRCNSNFGFSTTLPAGTYEVRVEEATYSRSAGINLLPVSYQVNAALTVNGPQTGLMLNEVGFAVSGVIQVNGATPVSSNPTYCQSSGNMNDSIALVHFIDATRGYDAFAAVTCRSNFSFSTTLPAGTYDVRLEQATYTASAGLNLMPVSYQVNAALTVNGPQTGLVLNEVGFAVGGVLQVNGATPVLANAAYCQSSGNQNDAIATVRFVEKTKGYVAFTNVRCNSNFGFSTTLPAGTYEVRVEEATYSRSAGINLLPVSYQVNAALTVNGPQTGLMLNEVGFAVSGVIQVNGATPVSSNPTYCQSSGNMNDSIALVHFIDATRGYDAFAAVTCRSNFSFSTTLPAGTYDVRLEQATYTASAGLNLMPVSYQAVTRLRVP